MIKSLIIINSILYVCNGDLMSLEDIIRHRYKIRDLNLTKFDRARFIFQGIQNPNKTPKAGRYLIYGSLGAKKAFSLIREKYKISKDIKFVFEAWSNFDSKMEIKEINNIVIQDIQYKDIKIIKEKI